MGLAMNSLPGWLDSLLVLLCQGLALWYLWRKWFAPGKPAAALGQGAHLPAGNKQGCQTCGCGKMAYARQAQRRP